MTTPRRTAPADLDLVHALSRAFVEAPELDSSGIRIAVRDGRVELTGRVATRSQRLAAATRASAIRGVTAVDNRLEVGDIDVRAGRLTADEIRDAVVRTVADSTVPVAGLEVRVEQHVVRLAGRVTSERERSVLLHEVQEVPGVHFVDNRLDVEPGLLSGAVEELPPAASLALLAGERIGRLAVQDGPGVDIFPVNYVLHDDRVYFRSAPGVKLIRLVEAPEVAFEVDGRDGDLVWSVVVKGAATRLDDDDEILASGIAGAATAHPSDKQNFVRIEPRELTGRRFRPVD